MFSVAESLRDSMAVILFNITFTCVIAIACNLFVLEMNGKINMEIIVALIDLGVVIGLTFAYFFLSEWITTDLFAIDEIFYNSPWFRLSTDQQKLLVLPIMRADREFRLTGLGIFECSLAVFATV